MPAQFTLNDGSNISVQMMHTAGGYQFFRDNELQAIAIPYIGGNLSMIVLLPNVFNDSPDKYMNQENFTMINNSMATTRVYISMPKFSFNTDYSLAHTLESMGMEQAFSDKYADFSSITDADRLYIGDVLHKAYIQVDEHGTIATAATAVRMEATPQVAFSYLEFNANHQFAFMIEDTSTGEILFLGKISNPTK